MSEPLHLASRRRKTYLYFPPRSRLQSNLCLTNNAHNLGSIRMAWRGSDLPVSGHRPQRPRISRSGGASESLRPSKLLLRVPGGILSNTPLHDHTHNGEEGNPQKRDPTHLLYNLPACPPGHALPWPGHDHLVLQLLQGGQSALPSRRSVQLGVFTVGQEVQEVRDA